MIVSSEKDDCPKPSGPAELLVVNQVLGPPMKELLEYLSGEGIRCKALTGWVDAEEPRQLPFQIVWAKPLEKSPTWRRLWTWGAFTLQAACRMARWRRTPALVTTNPPWTMLLMPLLKRLLSLRYVLLILDVYPDVPERMGKLRKGAMFSRLWRCLSRRAMLQADGVITLGERMADTLRAHLREGEHCAIEIIPDWVDIDFIRPVAKEDNPFVEEHGLRDRFVVVYSGSFGATHDVESIVAAAEMLADTPEVSFLLIGGGTRRREVERLLHAKKLPNVRLLPLQPLRVVPYSLAAADCAIICLGEGYEGVSVPSKTYYAMAAGAALLVISGEGTELVDIVTQHRCGFHVRPHRPKELAAAVRDLWANPELLQEYKAASRRACEQHYTREKAVRRHLEYLRNTLMSG